MRPRTLENADTSEQARRQRMVRHQLKERGISDPRVLKAMADVPRSQFVLPADRRRAYEDKPLPIGYGQTLSQPLMVATVLEALELTGQERVLEVGAGSGYLAALLGRLAAEVHAIELNPHLARRARLALADLGAWNVFIQVGDGSLGHAAKSPFDAIVVSAAAEAIPRALLAQLGAHGRLIMPLGNRERQVLVRVRRRGLELEAEGLGGCAFVPLRSDLLHDTTS